MPGHKLEKRRRWATEGKILFRICILILICLYLPGIQPVKAMPEGETTTVDSSLIDPSRQMQDSASGNLRFRVEVNLVTTDVRVIGKSLSEFGPDDFVIYDNKVSQEVTFFSYDQLPIAVALLVDSSGSVISHFPSLQIASLLSLKNLKPEDQVALFSFSSSCERHVDLTEDRLLVAREITSLKAGGGTNISNALYHVARYLHEEAPDRRRAIILISDNCGQRNIMNMTSDHDVEEEILEAAATLYNIRTPQSFDPSLCRESNAMVKEMVDVSGGEMFQVGSSTSLQTALKTTIQNLRYQYTLGFSPSDQGEAGSYHRLDVKLRRPELCPECGLLTRKGYYAGIGERVIQNAAVRPVRKADIIKTNELLIQRSILTAGTTTLDLKDIGIDIETTRREGLRKQPQLIVYLNIDPAGIEFKKTKGYRIYSLHVALFYADKNGEILGNDWRRLEDALNEEDYGRIMEEGIGFQTSIPIKAEEQMLKVVVYDAESDRIGSKLVSLSD